jgi:hypothetical protein
MEARSRGLRVSRIDRIATYVLKRTRPHSPFRTTSNAADYLKLKHRITSSGEVTNSQRIITSCKLIVDSNTLRKLIVECIVDRRQAFN